MKSFALAMLFLNPVLWASFYAISKKALHDIDPVTFVTLELSVAAIPALLIVALRSRTLDRDVVRTGALLGGVLFLAVIGSTIALYFTTATNTAFFPALNGAIAALITVVVLRKRIAAGTLWATALASLGALLVIAVSSQGGGSPIGDFIALAAAAAYTMYIFAVDHQVGSGSKFSVSKLLTISCVEIIVMALLAWIVFLAQGRPFSGFQVGREVAVSALYVGLFTTLAPTMIAVFFQRHVNLMTVALLYVLEPVWGAIAAVLIEGEVITPFGYAGGALIVAASVINIVAAASAPADGRDEKLNAATY